MKILLATDGSTYSNSAVEEIAGKTLPSGTEVHVLSVYERYSLLMKTRLSMGGDLEYYARRDAEARKAAEEAVNQAEKVLKDKRPELVRIGLVNGFFHTVKRHYLTSPHG